MLRRLILAGLLLGATAVGARASTAVDLTNDNSGLYKPFGSPFAVDVGSTFVMSLGGGLTLTGTASEALGSSFGGGTAVDDVGQSEWGLGVIGNSGLPQWVDNYPSASQYGAETLTLSFSSAVTLDSATFFTIAPGTKVAVNGTTEGTLTNGTSSLSLGLSGTTFAFTVPTGINDSQWSYALKGVGYTAATLVGGPSGAAVPLPPALWSGLGMLLLMGTTKIWRGRAR